MKLRPECCINFECAHPEDWEGKHHPGCKYAPPIGRDWNGEVELELPRDVPDSSEGDS